MLDGKRVLILGVANERSIAWGVAKKLRSLGARIALTFPGEVLEKRVLPLADELGADWTFKCDVSDSSDVNSLAGHVSKEWGQLDVLVHSVAFADREDLKGDFMTTSEKGFQKCLSISCFSLVQLCNALSPCLQEGSSVMTMTYIGSRRVMPGYNLMGVAKAALESSMRYLALDLGERGIRVNAISAGPVKTLAASGISGFRDFLKRSSEVAPLKRNVDIEDIGDTAVFFASDLSKSVTGQILHVDGGLHTLGVQ